MTSEQTGSVKNGDSSNLAAEFQKSSLENKSINEENIAKADKFKEEGNAEFKSKL